MYLKYGVSRVCFIFRSLLISYYPWVIPDHLLSSTTICGLSKCILVNCAPLSFGPSTCLSAISACSKCKSTTFHPNLLFLLCWWMVRSWGTWMLSSTLLFSRPGTQSIDKSCQLHFFTIYICYICSLLHCHCSSLSSGLIILLYMDKRQLNYHLILLPVMVSLILYPFSLPNTLWPGLPP